MTENWSFNKSTSESEQPSSTWWGGGGLSFLGLASEANEAGQVLYQELKAA